MKKRKAEPEGVEWAEAVSAPRPSPEEAEEAIEAEDAFLEARIERAREWGRAKKAGGE